MTISSRGVVANHHRPDVEGAGFGSGRYGFDVVFNPPLLPSRSWLIQILSEADGQEIPGSPLRLPASNEFDGEARAALAATLGSAGTMAELDDRIRFLTARTGTPAAEARGPAIRPPGA